MSAIVGAKGAGEPGIIPTAAAIANAVADALGVRVDELPITPARVLEALHRATGDHATPHGAEATVEQL